MWNAFRASSKSYNTGGVAVAPPQRARSRRLYRPEVRRVRELTRFVDDGVLDVDSNLIENAIRLTFSRFLDRGSGC
jgi:hypothetical protein